MKAIAGSQLRRLHPQKHRKLLKPSPQRVASGENSEQGFGIHSIGRSVTLSHHSQATGLEPEYDGQADETFVSNQPDFNYFPVWLRGEDRSQTIVQEIAGFYGLADLMKHLTQPQAYKFQGRKELLAFLAGKGSEDKIFDFSPVVICGRRGPAGP